MTEEQLYELIEDAKCRIGVKCTKYAGAITVELLKNFLAHQGINTSPRDVFIEGVPVEIDLLVPKRGVVPQYGVLYRAEDVLAVFEVKNHGSFGAHTVENTKRAFKLIQDKNPRIWCAYVALKERRGYPYAVTDSNLGSSAYTFRWYSGSRKRRLYESSGDHDRLMEKLKSIVERSCHVV